jgi:hypothetical protein
VTCLSLFISWVPTPFACFPLNPTFTRRLVPPRFNRTIPGIPPRGKGDRCVGLITSPPSIAECLEILGASFSWRPKSLSRPVQRLLYVYSVELCRIQWPHGLKRLGSAAARLLEQLVLTPRGVWMYVCCECSVLSGRGIWDGLITHPEVYLSVIMYTR